MNRPLAIKVAEDVLKQIEQRCYRPENHGWIDRDNLIILIENNTQKENDNLQTCLLFLSRKTPCGVCALGGAFLSYVRLRNKVKTSSVIDSDDIVSVMLPVWKKIFGASTFLMEIAFEKGKGQFHYLKEGNITFENFDTAVSFGKRYRSPRGRMIAIFQNVIDNNGQFVP